MNRSPSGRGFVQLGHTNSRGNEQDIPLTNVRSNVSSTGARKPHGTATGMSTQDPETEKHGIFHRGRRQAKPQESKAATRSDTLASNEFSLNFMGKVYNKIIGFSVVTRYLVYIVPVGMILAVPLVVLAVTGHKEEPVVGYGASTDSGETRPQGPPLFDLFLWIECTWICLWGAKLVAHLLSPFFMFFTGVISAGTRKYATIIRALEIPLSLFLSALASWLLFENLMPDFETISWVSTMKKILGATFTSSGIFLAEKLIVQLISITYHQRSFANRIQDSKREVHLLGLLYDASRTLFPMYCPEFAEEDYVINDSIEMMLGGGKKRKGHQKSNSIAPMQLIARAGGEVGRFGDKVTSVFGHVASEITGKQVFNPNSAHTIVIEALEKTRTSEAIARRIWMSFVVEGNDALFAEDIVEVLGEAQRDEAEEAFAAIDSDLNGDISLDEMIRKVVEISKERKAIAHSMKDIGQALSVFDKILLFVVFLLTIFVFLGFFIPSFLTTVAAAGTALLSLSFVFAVTAQEFLGSCIFLFVKHPYDVGDRVDIAGPEKEQLIVERISLLYTAFNRIDKMQVVQVPNIVLNNMWIENVSRSKAMRESIEINVSYDTSFEDIELLRLEMEKFVQSPDNSRDFLPDVTISVGGVGDCDKLTLITAIKHKSNWHNDAVRATRRSKFLCALTLALKRVPIFGPGGGGDALGAPSNPSYSVAVSDSDAAAARAKSEQDKNAARMVPKMDEADDPVGAEAREAKAVAGLNTLSPTFGVDEDWGYNRNDHSEADEEDANASRRSTDTSRTHIHKSTSLHKTASQRSGRRKAGESLPPPPHAPGPELSVTAEEGTSPFDEEAQVGGPNPYTTHTHYGQSLYPPGNRDSRIERHPSGNRKRGSSVSHPGPQ